MIPSKRTRACALTVVSAVLLLGVVAAPAAVRAQSVESLNNKVERLQREVTDLQRAFYRGGGSSGSGGSASADGGASGGDPAAARLEVRISEMETQLRELTGQVEQLSFQMRQLSQRMETFAGDTEYRLQLLETGSAPAAQTGDVQTGDTQGASSQSGSAQSGGAASGSQPTTLGQVSQSDVDALRQQDGASAGVGQADSGGSSQSASAGSSAARGGYDLPDGSPEEQYSHAFGLLRQMNYGEAERALSAFLQRHPDHRLAGNAKYWLGETYYVRSNYRQAAVTFAEGFKDYPDSNKAPDNLLKLAISLGELDRKQDACGALVELLNRYPDLSDALRQRARREQQKLACG